MLRVIVLLALLLAPSAAHAQKRIALLVANKDYKPGVGALVNPLNDARLVGEALKTIGFEVLGTTENARRTDMLLAIHAFAAKLKAAGPDAIGFLYYSGHGLASLGENYLIPVDVEEASTVQLSVLGVKHSEVLAILRSEAPNAAHYLVLDACRNTLQGSRGGKGFVPLGQQSGVLVAFAAEPGKTASDTGRASGPYAAALAAELVKPGQSDLIMFHNVRVAVMDRTNGDQVPWTEDGIQRRERVRFGGGETPPSSQLRPPSPGPASAAAEAWSATKDTTNIALLEAFIERYKDTFYAELARARMKELKSQQVAAAPPPAALKPSLPPPAAPLRIGRCSPGPDKLGVARTVEIDTAGAPGFGFEQYKAHDFLLPKEVVLTFDDGPWPGTTAAVLEALAQHCVQATFFPIGKHALWHPEILKEVAAAGHSVGAHTWAHANLATMKGDQIEEIEKGFSAVKMALGAPPAPFFRFPYMKDTREALAYLATRNIGVFSFDLDSLDFKMRKPEDVVSSVMTKLERMGKGIILMHDFQQATAKAMPAILTQLRAKGYKVVHMRAKLPLQTIARWDEAAKAEIKAVVGGDRPTSSVVRSD